LRQEHYCRDQQSNTAKLPESPGESSPKYPLNFGKVNNGILIRLIEEDIELSVFSNSLPGRKFFLIKSRKDDICDFLLLTS
jgi:hypothetical protein